MFKSKASRNEVISAKTDGGFALDCDAVRQMVEDMPINVMVCDLKDFRITYVNKSTQEIARNAQQPAAGTSEVSSNVSGVNQAATETGAASGQVLEASKGLATQSNKLSEQIEAFLKSLIAA